MAFVYLGFVYLYTLYPAAAIIQRWKQLAAECDLEVRVDKCHVTSPDGDPRQEEYDEVDVSDGFLLMGIPFGKPAWEKEKCTEIAAQVAGVYTNARLIETKQSAQLLSVYCGGVADVLLSVCRGDHC